MSHFYLACPSIRKIKEKKKKRNINNDLADLPSHDTESKRGGIPGSNNWAKRSRNAEGKGERSAKLASIQKHQRDAEVLGPS